MGFTKVNGACEADVKEGHGNDDHYACGPNGAGEPKSNGCKRVEPGGRVYGTTERLGDNLPDEHDESENIANSNPEVSLVGGGQLLKVRKTKFGLQTVPLAIDHIRRE